MIWGPADGRSLSPSLCPSAFQKKVNQSFWKFILVQNKMEIMGFFSGYISNTFPWTSWSPSLPMLPPNTVKSTYNKPMRNTLQPLQGRCLLLAITSESGSLDYKQQHRANQPERTSRSCVSRAVWAQDSHSSFEKFFMDELKICLWSHSLSLFSVEKPQKLLHSIKPAGLDNNCLSWFRAAIYSVTHVQPPELSGQAFSVQLP